MDVRLDYGRDGLPIRLADYLRLSVVEPSKGAPLAQPSAAVETALRHPIGARPLAELARGRRDAVVVISDKTRPVPNGLVLPPILRTLEAAGIGRERIEILVATGLHRANTHDELIEMTSAGDRRALSLPQPRGAQSRRARASRPHHAAARRSGSTRLLAADLKIVTGLIEPHLMAGYSGGRKGVAPGLAGVETMRSAHGPTMLEDNVGPGIIDGNPFHEDLLEIVRHVARRFPGRRLHRPRPPPHRRVCR